MEKIKRKYSCKDSTMLHVAIIVGYNLKDNLAELSVVNKKWTTGYTDDFILRVDNTLIQHLGIYAKKDLKDSTINLIGLVDKVKQDLASFKRFVGVCFKDNPTQKDYVFSLLGFNQYYPNKRKINQYALINLLFAFKTNFSDSLKTTLINYGMPESIIDNIITSANNVDKANDVQERNKLLAKEISFNRRKVLNDIYDEVINICSLAKPFYKGMPVKSEMFTFSKIAGKINKRQKVENHINDSATEQQIDNASVADNADNTTP